ncbi:hypothetical protein [Pseudonocardia alaniniphila]|uniref:Uncharacterized protein n=1 Tax=Pseudonocardia alaniniphila TaxID=75291 RepID=A0ABS9TMM1_9PSEU|nr:hypothetical protein [Pseudonocardia alaniniphila]MCH6169787.1 hypothetical protein [Pseudonocardia alaniniphila]
MRLWPAWLRSGHWDGYRCAWQVRSVRAVHAEPTADQRGPSGERDHTGRAERDGEVGAPGRAAGARVDPAGGGPAVVIVVVGRSEQPTRTGLHPTCRSPTVVVTTTIVVIGRGQQPTRTGLHTTRRSPTIIVTTTVVVIVVIRRGQQPTRAGLHPTSRSAAIIVTTTIVVIVIRRGQQPTRTGLHPTSRSPAIIVTTTIVVIVVIRRGQQPTRTGLHPTSRSPAIVVTTTVVTGAVVVVLGGRDGSGGRHGLRRGDGGCGADQRDRARSDSREEDSSSDDVHGDRPLVRVPAGKSADQDAMEASGRIG